MYCQLRVLWSDHSLKNNDLLGDGGLCLTVLEVCALFFHILPSLKFGERMEVAESSLEMDGLNEPSYMNTLG